MQSELQISKRGIDMPQSPIRKFAPLAYDAEDRGMKIYRLNIGQPDLPTPQKALDVLKSIDRKTLEYSPSQGYRSLRQALVGYYDRYQIELDADADIDKTVNIYRGGKAKKTKIAANTYIAANTDIENGEIGKFCSIADHCRIGMSDQSLQYISTSPIFTQKINALMWRSL